MENELNTGDKAYIDYCGSLAAKYPYVPWEMCNGVSADNTINSCNGGSCTDFIERGGQNGKVLVTQPALWTEDWIGWYQVKPFSHFFFLIAFHLSLCVTLPLGPCCVYSAMDGRRLC